MKSAISGCVSRAVMVVEGTVEHEGATDDVGDKKLAISCQCAISPVITLVEPNSEFFSFLGSAGGCGVAMRVGELISRCWDDELGCVKPNSGGFGAGEGADVAVACGSLLC